MRGKKEKLHNIFLAGIGFSLAFLLFAALVYPFSSLGGIYVMLHLSAFLGAVNFLLLIKLLEEVMGNGRG